jgi:hypothetical protein
MKYRFEKMERELTPEERKVRTRIAFSILFAILIVLIILFGQRWYKVQVFHKRVAELKTLVEAGRLLDACEMIRVRDRESASAAARWAQVTGNDRIVKEMKLINSTHSPDWSVWETVIRFSLDVESGYDKVFIYMKWTQEDGKWVFGLMDAREYRPTDGELGMKLGDMLESFTGLNLEDYLKEEPPGVPE